ncbi:hypothetical protein HMPREF0972_00770 [Actinomyces sp. oral taxon 848 str. F0332]|nr:hypothetical protein HMPREF0972_00770 [Actinomyces sp. oral taxon 848 str. F0332]
MTGSRVSGVVPAIDPTPPPTKCEAWPSKTRGQKSPTIAGCEATHMTCF